MINGQDFAHGRCVDLSQLAKSCQSSGEIFIVTCGCGFPPCAGIFDGIRVRQEAEAIVWEVPDPLSYDGMSTKAEWIEANRQFLTYCFEPKAYQIAAQTGIDQAKALLAGPSYPDSGPLNPDDLLRLHTSIFSQRGAPPGCHILARNIVIQYQPPSITMDGVEYDILELPIPLEIKAEVASVRPAQGASAKSLGGSSLTPEWVLRKRTRRVAAFLASIQTVLGAVRVVENYWTSPSGITGHRELVIRGSWIES